MSRPEPKRLQRSRLRDPVLMTRIFFVLGCIWLGYWIGRGQVPSAGVEGSFLGLFVALLAVGGEYATSHLPARRVMLAALGLLGGLIFGMLTAPVVPRALFGLDDPAMADQKARALCTLVFGYFGIMMALKHADRLSFSRLGFLLAPDGDHTRILDTSVVIDGRIKGLISAGLLQGAFVVPEFVLEELQKLADSQDRVKRQAGRRGLAVLEELRETTDRLVVMEQDYPEIKETDQKLVALARQIAGQLLTNDINLQKVAAVHRIRVLNINELSTLLRPPLSNGDQMRVLVSREGKDPTQGVAYLEDGTMVVVEDGRSVVGSEVDVEVVRVLQTGTGRMVFARQANVTTPPPMSEAI